MNDTITTQQISFVTGFSEKFLKECIRAVFPGKMGSGKVTQFDESEVDKLCEYIINDKCQKRDVPFDDTLTPKTDKCQKRDVPFDDVGQFDPSKRRNDAKQKAEALRSYLKSHLTDSEPKTGKCQNRDVPFDDAHVTNEECPSHDIPSPDDIYDGKLVELNQDAWGAEAKITYAGLLKQPPHLRRRLVEEGLTKAYKGLKPKPPASWLSLFDYAAPEHKIALLSMRKPDLAGAYRTVLATAVDFTNIDYRTTITQLLPDDTEQEIHF